MFLFASNQKGSVPSRIVNKITANQPASIGIVKKVVEEMYREELANPDRPPSKFKMEALDLAFKLKRAREVMAASHSPAKDAVDSPIVTPQSAPELQALDDDLSGSPDDQVVPVNYLINRDILHFNELQ